jgi:hypothetical protein
MMGLSSSCWWLVQLLLRKVKLVFVGATLLMIAATLYFLSMEIYTQEATIDSRGMMIMVVATKEQQQLPPPPPLITTTTTTTQAIVQQKPPPPPFPAVQVWEDHKRCHSQESLLRQPENRTFEPSKEERTCLDSVIRKARDARGQDVPCSIVILSDRKQINNNTRGFQQGDGQQQV